PLLSWSLVKHEGPSLSIHKIAQEIVRILLDTNGAEIFSRLHEDEKSTKYWIGRTSELLYPLHGQFIWRNFDDQSMIVKHTRSCLEYSQLYDIDCAINKALLYSFSTFVLLNQGESRRSDLWKVPLSYY